MLKNDAEMIRIELKIISGYFVSTTINRKKSNFQITGNFLDRIAQ